jgi:hypothetical protein
MTKDWRSLIAQIYIEWGNKFTFIKGEEMDELRRIKKSQDEDSQNNFQRTRPPEGTDIEYIYFRIFDIFQIEDTDSLINGLKKLFPKFDDPFFRGDYHEKFIRNATGISVGEWLNLGYLYRERKGRFSGDISKELRELPPQVDYLHIALHKVLPSIFVLTYDVHLDDCATNELKQLQCSFYRSKIRFRKIIPFGRAGGGYSSTPSEIVMKQEITNWLSRIRYHVEKCIEPFLGGEFFSDKSSNNPRLPAIEIFGFKGMPESKTALWDWISNSMWWLESLGFHVMQIGAFTDGKLIYVPRIWQNDDRNPSPYRVIVMWDQYLESINLEMYGGNEKFAIADNTQEDFLEAILSPLVIFELLRRFQMKFEKIRQNVFKTMKPFIFNGYYLGKYIKLSDNVLHASALYDRISKDFEYEADNISKKLKAVSDFREVGTPRENSPRQLDQKLLEGVKYRIGIFKDHVDFAMNWLSQYVALRNLSVTYYLALVAGITALISLLLSLKNP